MNSNNNLRGGLTEDQHGFIQFIADLSTGHLRSTYQSYCFLADFGRADDVWKRDACRAEFMRRGLDIPERKQQGTEPTWDSADFA